MKGTFTKNNKKNKRQSKYARSNCGLESGQWHEQEDCVIFYAVGSHKVLLITKYNHFEFNEEFKGKVHCKTDLQGNDFVFRIFPSEEGPSGFPELITPTGK